jgi:hypothetical protein
MAGTIVYVYFRALFGYPNVGLLPRGSCSVHWSHSHVESGVGIVAKLAKNLY